MKKSNINNIIKRILPLGTMTALLLPTLLYAGGFSRSGEDIDILFKDGHIIEASMLFARPERDFTNVQAVDRTGVAVTTGLTQIDPSLNIELPTLSAKFTVNPQVDCMIASRRPYGFDLEHGSDWVGRYKNTRFNAKTKSIRTVCSYKKTLNETSQLRIIGGIGAMTGSARREHFISNAATQVLPASVGDAYNILNTGESNTAKTWQAGVAFEVPDKAMRASLVYSSKADLELKGTQHTSNPIAGTLIDRDVDGVLSWPESVELKLQSGIKPGWLAMGSIKWQNWSKFYEIPIHISATGQTLITFKPAFRDGLTVSAGIGHQLSPKLDVYSQIKWDRGTSTGYNSANDSWSIGLGGRYQLDKNFALKGGVGVAFSDTGHATTDDPVVDYDFGDQVIYVVSTGIEIKF